MIRLALIVSALAAASPAFAQMPQTRPLTVTFSGVVTSDVQDTISIRQPDGSFAPYRGPVPEYPYRRGDAVSISFTTTVPTSAYYANNPQVPRASDGIYRFIVGGPFGNGNGFGVTRNFDVAGPLNPSGSGYGIGGITLVYDTNTESYGLEFPRGTYGVGPINGPGYQYDAGTGALILTSGNCTFAGCEGNAELIGNATDARVRTGVGTTAEPGNIGFFDLLFSGSWNLPAGGTGGPTQVPEPGTMLLFGAGTAWLVRRTRKKNA
jgi:PEP-CTERM motif